MSLSSATAKVQHVGSGTSYSYPFYITDKTELQVVVLDEAGVETTLTKDAATDGYTVTDALDPDNPGGTITTTSTYTATDTITITRLPALTQTDDYRTSGLVPPETVEKSLDHAVMILQYMNEILARCVRMSVSSALTELEIPVVAKKVIGWNNDADGFALYSTTTLQTLDMVYLSDYASLGAAIIANPSATIIIDADADIDADTTVPSTSPLWRINAAKLSVATSKTLTLNCPILADSGTLVTDKAGAGTVAGNPIVPFIDASWFDTSGGLTDSTGTSNIKTMKSPTITGPTITGHNITGAGVLDFLPRDISQGLTITRPTAATIDIDATLVVLHTTASPPSVYGAKSVNLTVDITASGANGLDAGSEASNTSYYLWVIYNPTTDTVAGLMSTSNSAPTMPSGYTYKALVGTCYNNSDGDLNSTLINIMKNGRMSGGFIEGTFDPLSSPLTVTSTLATKITLNLGSFAVGDIIAVSGGALFTKGGGAGKSGVKVTGNGTATLDGPTIQGNDIYQEASLAYNISVHGVIYKITAAGTAQMVLACESDGSDSTITDSGSHLRVDFLEKI